MKNLFTLSFLLFSVLASGQWSTMEMPDVRFQIGGAATPNEIFIVGGIGTVPYTPKVLVYNTEEEAWSELALALGRAKIACAVAGGKLFAGGGIEFQTPVNYDLVDVIDLETGEVEVAGLTQARTELAAAAVGSKVLFAGGLEILTSGQTPTEMNAFDIVDIYDLETGEWTTAQLSQARGGLASAVAGNKAFFAGGYLGDGTVSDVVDIYDADTDTWTSTNLSQARAFYGNGASNGSKVFFAGGIMPDDQLSDVVDIYDIESQSWSSQTLSEARFGIQAVALGDNVFFAGGGEGSLLGWIYTSFSDVVDIFNTATDTWSVHQMVMGRINHVALRAGNQVFFIGGFDGPTADVFTDETVSPTVDAFPKKQMEVYPNPIHSDELTIRFNATPGFGSSLVLINLAGQVLQTWRPSGNNMSVSMGALPSGVYFLQLHSSEGIVTRRFVRD